MKITIDADKLKDYVIIHKADIGVDVCASCSCIVTGLTIFIPELRSALNSGKADIAQWILLIVGVTVFCYGTYRIVQFARRRYNAKTLYTDVKNMDETHYRFSLVAIKDTFNTYPNRFLLKHDDDWKCDLFFSFPTKDEENEDIDNIKRRLSHLLKVPESEISVEYVDEALQTKFSQREKIMKAYDHRLYHAEIAEFPSFEKADTFEVDGIAYKWETIEEMKKDDDIREKNLDVVNFVSANIP